MNEEFAIAPADWYWHLLPLAAPGETELDLERVTEIALERIERGLRCGDESHFGDTLHWAHLLKAEQGADGGWPAVVDPRTGEALSARRTRRPALLLRKLNAVLETTEFDNAVALAESCTRAPVSSHV